MTLPNIITIARLVLVPTIVWLMITEQYVLAFWGVIVCGVGDSIDGFIARQFNLASQIGAYLDPLADKALLASIYIVLATKGEVPAWLAIMVVSRDVVIVGAIMLSRLIDRPVEVKPLVISKANTFVQILLAVVVLGDLAIGLDLASARSILVVLVAILTLTSGAAYLVGWARHIARA